MHLEARRAGQRQRRLEPAISDGKTPAAKKRLTSIPDLRNDRVDAGSTHRGELALPVVGGTVEERGFNPDLTAGGVLALLEAAWRALPTIEELPIDELWTGFRPTSRDDAPILGPTAVEGLFVATGHHRNGILLTPLTALTVSEAILSGRVPDLIREFTIDRFTGRAGRGADRAAQGRVA